MKAKAGGLILFSLAFSSVFSSPEIVAPSKAIEGVKIVEEKTREWRGSDGENGSREPSKIERDHEMAKRDAEIYKSNGDEGGLDSEAIIGRKSPEESLLNSKLFAGSGDDFGKRNRMRFTGMRGKKECPRDRPCRETEPETENGDSPVWKRTSRNYGEFLGGKRAPLAFHGMRGKKSGQGEWEGDEETEPEVRRFAGFTEFPGERFLMLESGLFDGGNGIPEVDFQESLEGSDPGGFRSNKRSPYSFQGMRGKKTAEYDLKRAMGFLGMRGKKEPEVWISDYRKRAPQSSFFGMKGKKAQSGFFGMRGKKSSLASSFDSKGIGKPFDFDLEEINSSDEIKDGESTKDRFRRGTNRLNSNGKITKVELSAVGGENKQSHFGTPSAYE